MRYFKSVILFLIGIVILSCSNDNSNVEIVEFESFGKEFQLQSEKAHWLDIWNCGDIRIYDSLLVVVDWKRKGGSIRFYNIHKKELLGAFGGFGKGPGEFFNSPYICPEYSYSDNDLVIQLFDNGRSLIQNIEVFKSLNEQEIQIRESFKLPDELRGFRTFITEDSLLYSPFSSALHRYSFTNGESAVLHEPVDFKQNFPNEQFEQIARIMYLELEPRTGRIVSSFNVMRRLNVYDSAGNLIRIIREKGSDKFDLSDSHLYNRNREHFTRTFLSEDSILVLDTDRLIGEGPPSKLLLFDYKGNTLIKYITDRFIRYGAVDWKNGVFYANDIEDGGIVLYNLPDITD